ncbi:hypothetical protein [Endozoicomonas sp. Mp262]|uniref:hypothetical protein n=1 Tax=Endozoicomonas sp. Mp262 TaxID=2919499 RepID=UPI0021E0066D
MMLDHIELPDDLLWVDEFDWNPVAQAIDRSLTGALMVQEQAKLYGRPITLTGGDEAGWVTRATVLELMALANMPDKKLPLIFSDGRTFSVCFRRNKENPIFATPVLLGIDVYYFVKIQFIVFP